VAKDLNLTEMKRTAPELKEASAPVESKPSPYPWGLSLRLEEESLEKLGLSTLPKVGTEFIIVARACVTEVSEHESTESDGKRQSLGMQIEAMSLEKLASKDGPGAAEVLYGGGKKS
jgi:hypothetical protein